MTEQMLPLALTATGGRGFALSGEVTLQLTKVAEAEWQQRFFQAVLVAQSEWETEYQTAVAQAEMQQGVQIQGRNPARNEEIIRTELKRAVLHMLGAPPDEELRAVSVGGTGPDGLPRPPQADLDKTLTATRLITFFEQAFEWENLSYVLYSYFWTGRDDRPEQSLREDVDPEFGRFLRAGASRVTVPVRTTFLRQVASRLSLTVPSGIGHLVDALPADSPYLDIAEEIAASTDGTDGGALLDCWPLVVPTTLVALDGTPMFSFPTPCTANDESGSTATPEGDSTTPIDGPA